MSNQDVTEAAALFLADEFLRVSGYAHDHLRLHAIRRITISPERARELSGIIGGNIPPSDNWVIEYRDVDLPQGMSPIETLVSVDVKSGHASIGNLGF